MNMLANKEDKTMVPFGLPLMPRSFFGNDIIDRLAGNWGSLPAGNLMRQYAKEDGSTVLEYNLAGFEPKDISAKIDTALGELIITAKSEAENNKRSFSTVVTLSPYTTAEDISTAYKNGVLEVTVAPLEKRKEESLVEIPIG